MKKYLFEFKLSLLSSFQYRFNTIINLIFSNIGIVITLFFWRLIYAGIGNSDIQGFSLSDMATYFVLSSVFRAFILNGSGFEFSTIIKSGKLSSYLIKPFNINLSLYAKSFARAITGVFPQVLILILLLPFFPFYTSWEVNIQNMIFASIFLIISSLSSHLLWSLLGYSAFIIENANAVMWLFAVLLNLITGAFIPLDFFPQWAVRLLHLLPFSAWGYIPIKLCLNMYSSRDCLLMVAIHCGWIVILVVFNKLLWKKGTQHYTAVGG